MPAKILKSENFLDSRRMCWTKQNTERLDQAFGVGYDRDAMLLNQGHLLPAISPLSIKKFAARSFVGSGRPLWRGAAGRGFPPRSKTYGSCYSDFFRRWGGEHWAQIFLPH